MSGAPVVPGQRRLPGTGQPTSGLADPAFWSLPAERRSAVFAELRRLPAPVYVVERRGSRTRREQGYYALVRHGDVVLASRRPEVFRSGTGVTTPRPSAWVRRVFGDSMVNLDDPRHARLRGVVSRAFTPRRVAQIEGEVARAATEVVDHLVARGTGGDFVELVAARLPCAVICTMMGIPPERRGEVLAQVDLTTDHSGAGARRPLLRVPGRSLRALARMHRLVSAVGRDRRRRPRDDLISALVNTDVEGRHLDDRELGAFFSLLLVAGVETTRNALSHGLDLLSRHPDQRELLVTDLDRRLPGAVEEILRHATPIIQFRRTLAVDHPLPGCVLEAGRDVVLFYASANRDEAVFTDPDRFDITRAPNPHLAFGGGGPHFCLGAHLARQEMTILLRELFTRLPAITAVAEPERVPSSFDHRIARLPFAF